MTRYTLIGPDPNIMGQIMESESPPEPTGNPNIYWLPITDDTTEFDPYQQNRLCSYEIFPDYVQETCQVTDMTPDELSISRHANATRFDEVWFTITLEQENRIRALEGQQDPDLTTEDWQDKIKTILRGQSAPMRNKP